MQKIFIVAGSILGALGVITGAFGAHALKNLLEKYGRLDTYETAVKYHIYHAIALILTGIILNLKPTSVKSLEWAGYSFITGLIVFSGSLYILCLSGNTWWGRVTPVGGLFLIAGWALLAIGAAKS